MPQKTAVRSILQTIAEKIGIETMAGKRIAGTRAFIGREVKTWAAAVILRGAFQ